MGVADWVVSIAAVLAIPLVTYIVAKGSRRASAEQETIKRLSTRQDDLEDQQRLQGDYIFVLREHIAEGKGPPPPPWPEGMYR